MIICDRCKQPLHNIKYAQPSGLIQGSVTFRFSHENGNGVTELDLCGTCYEAFVEMAKRWQVDGHGYDQ